MRRSVGVILAVIVALAGSVEAEFTGRKALQTTSTPVTTTNSGGVNASEPVSCYNPPADTLDVPGSFPLFSLQGSGYVKYFCNNSTLDLDGEAYANVSSPDGVWVGIHEYPTSGVSLGMPTWYLHNTITGENRTIWGQNKPQVRENAPNGAAVDWWRRAVYHDISSYDTLAKDNYTIISGPNEPRTYYAIRNDTTSAPRPPGNTCNGDQDVIVPFTALYTMLSCDTDIAAYMPPPMLLAPVMAPPPLIELVPALAPVVDAVPPAVVPAPAVVDAVPPTITTEPIMASPIIAAPVVVPANTTAPPPTSAALPRNGQLALGLFAAAAYALL